MAQHIPFTFTRGEAGTTIQSRGLPRLLLTEMRPHQWTKNLFIFAPLLFGKKMTEMTAVGDSLLAFFVFCCLASGLYIFNDWIDVDEDRAHPEKRLRPISSGALSIPAALTASGILFFVGFSAAFFVGANFFAVAAFYLILNFAYCLRLKKVLILDCMCIATGFVLRVVGGAFAVNVSATHWLIVCAFLLALFLAFTKRRQELLTLEDHAGEHREVLGEYSVDYLEQINNILIAATIVCYALYTVAPETTEKFGTDSLIYGTIFVVYGMFRYMALIKKPENGGNPSKMLLRDRPLALTVVCWAIYNAILVYQVTLKDFWFYISA